MIEETENLLRILEAEEARGWTGVSQPLDENAQALKNLIDTVRKAIEDEYKKGR